MPDPDRRPPGWAPLWLAAAVLAAGLAAFVPVDCPSCEGGRKVVMSLGPVPCEACSERERMPLWKACRFRIARSFR